MNGRSWSLLGALAVSSVCARSSAQDRFEIQVYDTETATKGSPGVEMHVNVVMVGTHGLSGDGELPTDRVTHVTFEPHVGLARWCELGGYLQLAVRPDGQGDYAGVKLRLKSRIPRRFVRDIVGLALNIELSVVPARYEANVYGVELRPIIDFQWRRVYLSLNPIVSIDLAGAKIGRPQLEPAVKLAAILVPWAWLGVEYYAGLGAVTGFDSAAEQTHRVYLVTDITRPLTKQLRFDLNLGVGYNLVGNGDRWVLKTIFGFAAL
jgi:hypothetical protein